MERPNILRFSFTVWISRFLRSVSYSQLVEIGGELPGEVDAGHMTNEQRSMRAESLPPLSAHTELFICLCYVGPIL